MKTRVLYYSRKGNTKKVAEAIAQSLGAPVEQVPPAYPPENLNLLFLGTGVYAGKMDKKMQEFIRTLDASKAKAIALFGTCGGQDKAVLEAKELIKSKGIRVMDEHFLCKGNWFVFFNRNHPNDQDLKDAQEFAKRVAAALESK